MNKHALALAVGLATMQPQAIHALSLGEVQVESTLSQPLRARIALHDIAATDLSDLSIRVASERLFQRMGIERPFVLNNLKFDAVLYDDQPTLLVHTRYPLNEPFLNVLLEVSHQNQVVLQEYMLMPELPQVQLRADAGRQYRVNRGDTLFKIANRFRYAGTNTNQMMLAIVQDNPRAFVRGDGNRLKANVDIVIPTRKVVADVSRREAQTFRAQLTKQKLSPPPTLSKQPIVQVDRTAEALTEIEQARQHLKALKQKNTVVEQRLTTVASTKQTPQITPSGSLTNDSPPVLTSVERLNEQLNAQLEVKNLKIAELQMRLARLNKKLLIQDAEASSQENDTSGTLNKNKQASADFGLGEHGAFADDGHVIDIIALTTTESSQVVSGDSTQKTELAKPVATESRLNEPVEITSVATVNGKRLPPIDTPVVTAANSPTLSDKLPRVQELLSQPSQANTQDITAETQVLDVIDTTDAITELPSVSENTNSVESAAPTEVHEPAGTVNLEKLSKNIYALITSPWVLYLELGVFAVLIAVWLYARHRRRQREWRLVDDVVRDLEIKRTEEGRQKMVWDKLVYAPHDWMIALPEAMAQEVAPEAESKEPTQLPDVEQLEALLKNDKMKVRQSASRHQPVFPVSFVDDEDTQMPSADEANNEQVLLETSAMSSVDSPSALPGDQVEALRRQIDEMQRMLESLQQHRSYLEQQRDAA